VALGGELLTSLDGYADILTTGECNPLEDALYETRVRVRGIWIANGNRPELTGVALP